MPNLESPPETSARPLNRAALIYISFGLTKSASTFAYQLIEAVLRQAGHSLARLSPSVKGNSSRENYIDDVDGAKLQAIIAEIGAKSVVVKTHQRPDDAVLRGLDSGAILASATYRDPRDIALSMLDHAQRSRRLGVSEFSEFHTLEDTLPSIRHQFDSLRLWNSAQGLLLLPYDELCFDTPTAIVRIAAQLGAEVDEAKVQRRFANPRAIGQFNKGLRRRFAREMSIADQTRFLESFPDVYTEFFAGDDAVATDVQTSIAAPEPRSLMARVKGLWRR